MAKKKLKSNGIFFTGKASDDVTGSQYYIRFGDTQLLLECGLHQSSKNDYLEMYKINSEKFKFKPSELDFVMVNHTHIDHIGNIPRLVKEGFRGKIIATEKTARIMKPLLFNSCAILNEEARILSKKFGRSYSPLYSEEDVEKTLDLIVVYNDYNRVYTLNDNVSFQWLHNSHCVGAAQLQLILKEGNSIKRVLYTSDLGALKSNNHYVDKTEIPSGYNDVVLMESTYGDSKRTSKKKRDYDKEHLKAAIDTVIERKGTVIMPCFSFSRTQEILTTLYELYHDNKDFNTPVIVDSKLSCDISKLYNSLLRDDDLKQWAAVYNWENVRFIEDKEESNANIANPIPKIVLSSSGFCTNGRVVGYLRKYLKDSKSMVIFSGYVGDNSSYLSYRIKNYCDRSTIKVNGEMIPNKADCITLSTFSSHANCDDLIEYGSSLNTNKLVLVHGSIDAKKKLAEKLRLAISKKNKTFKVIEAVRGMTVRL